MDHSGTVVIGGGIIGAYCAYELARAGESVVIVDPAPASGASTGNAGMLVPSYCLPMANPATLSAGLASMFSADSAVSFARPITADTLSWLARFVVASRPGRAVRVAPELVSMGARSIDAYERLAARESIPLEVRRCGWLHAAETPAALRAHTKAANALRRLGVRMETLSGEAARERVQHLSETVVGAVHFPDDAAVDPTSACRAVLSTAAKHGARTVRALATGLIRDGDRVTAVRTDGGDIPAHGVVLAAGHRTTVLARRLGLGVPGIVPAQGWSLTLPADSGQAPDVALMSVDDHVVINATAGMVRLTGGMRFGGDPDEAPPQEVFDRLRATANRLVPSLSAITDDGQKFWGARPMTASGLPVTRRLLGNMVVAAGHGPLGMTLAPATAELAARLLQQTLTRSTR